MRHLEWLDSLAHDLAQQDATRISAKYSLQKGDTDPFAAAAPATRMPMIVTDPCHTDNPVNFANDAFCRLTGYERSEIVGRNCRILQGLQSDQAAVARVCEAIRVSRSIEIDVCNFRKNGEAFWNRLLPAPVHDANGEIPFFASQVDVILERARPAGLETHNAALTAELADRICGPTRSSNCANLAMRCWTRGDTPNLPKSLATGGLRYARDAIVQGGRLDEGLELLTKPFTDGELARKIRAVLDKQRAGSPSLSETCRGPSYRAVR